MANINIRNISIQNTVEPLNSEHHWDLKKCPLQRGVHHIEILLKLTLLLQILLLSALELPKLIVQSVCPYLSWQNQ